jgi:hypothetical protein
MHPPSKRFYVYNLADPHDKVFYVGKGCGKRVLNHEDEARRGCECHKCRKIRKIWRNGGEVRRYIVFETDNEDEAYEYEMQLISEIGLKNLCNKALGGRSGRSISDEEIAAWKEAIASDAEQKLLEKAEARLRATQIEDQRRENDGLPPGFTIVHRSRPYRKK